MSFLVIDASSSGVAGDMLIAAFLNFKNMSFRDNFCNTFNEHLSRLDPDFNCEWHLVEKNGISGIQMITEAKKRFSIEKLKEFIPELSQKLSLNSYSQSLAETAFNCIVEAEKEVHNIKNENSTLHLHELATLDTMFDLLGFAYLYQELDLVKFKTIILPIAAGGGTITISHGATGVPTPATISILKKSNLYVKGGPIENELFTPTGAAILSTLNSKSELFLPIMRIKQSGLSYGTKYFDKKGVSGLRVLIGEPPESFIHDEVKIIETNVDDVDGEILGYLFELLYDKQLVLDLSIVNTITKKNRPGFLIKAIVLPENAEKVIRTLVEELGTLGIRISTSSRHVIPRDIQKKSVSIDNKTEMIHLKLGLLGKNVVSEKVEYEDIKRIAKKKKLTLKEARKLIYSELSNRDE